MQQCKVLAANAVAQVVWAEAGFPQSLAERTAAWTSMRDGLFSMLRAYHDLPQAEASHGSSQASASTQFGAVTTDAPPGDGVPQDFTGAQQPTGFGAVAPPWTQPSVSQPGMT
jgi:hypothetical protein